MMLGTESSLTRPALEPTPQERPLQGIAVLDDLALGPSGHNKSIRLILPHLPQHGIELGVVGVWSFKQLVRSITNYWLVARKTQPDFILFNSLGSLVRPWGAMLLRLCLFTGIPVGIYWRELGPAFERLGKRRPRVLRWVDRLVQKYPNIIHLANSHITVETVRRRYPGTEPIMAGNCAWVPPPFDQPLLPLCNPPYVVSCGTIQLHKGVDLFVETAILVCRQHPTVEFYWIGQGNDFGNARQRIHDAGMTDRILFPGHISTPALLMRRASLVFIPSRAESFSQVACEAMCMGRQVVTFENGGPVEMLADDALVVVNFDTNEAATVILRLLRKTPQELVNHRARSRYMAHYTPEVHAARLVNILRASLAS